MVMSRPKSNLKSIIDLLNYWEFPFMKIDKFTITAFLLPALR